MKRVGIVTVYNSPNCGSYLQAYALFHVISGKTNQVFFIRTGARKFFLGSVKNDFNYFFHGRTKRLLWDIRRNARYSYSHRLIKKEGIQHSFDSVIFGSDEIWNVERDDFYRYPVFWGKGILAKRMISYAPSINTTQYTSIRLKEYILKYLCVFYALSARDGHTIDTIKAIQPTLEIKKVVDPTMLLSADQWKVIAKKYSKEARRVQDRPFIAVYLYERSSSPKLIEFVKRIAETMGMMTIAACTYLPWCDICEPGSPFDFLWYYSNASCVITNTFHGTVFSIIMNKPFISIGGSNTKVNELLQEFKQNCRNITIDDPIQMDSIIELLNSEPRTNNMVEKLREDSFTWLIEKCF